MNPLFPEIADDLSAVAERTVRPRRRWLPVLGSGAVVITVTGVATAATGVWDPPIGTPGSGRPPTISATGVPRDQAAILGVLRRDATPSDRGADVRRVLRGVGSGFRGVRTEGVRRIGTPTADGVIGTQILIPAVRAQGIDDALCLYVAFPKEGSGSTCFNTRQVQEGRAFLFTERTGKLTAAQLRANRDALRASARLNAAERADPKKRPDVSGREDSGSVTMARGRVLDTRFFGLVPDTVATVTRADKNGAHTATVRENAYQLVVPGPAEGRAQITWRASDGTVIQTMKR